MTATATAAGPRPTPHRLGVVFEILDELGEDSTFTFTLARVGEDAPLATADIHHKDSDGYGGLTRFLRAQGIGFEMPTQRQDTLPPPLAERLRAVVRVARHRSAAPPVLRRTDRAWTPGTRVTARAGAGRLLSADASARIIVAARSAGASVSAYLLHGLTAAVAPLVAEPAGSVTWGVPVNMRGPVRVVPDDANCSSIVPINVPSDAAPPAVHQALQEALAANLHWGKWDQLNTAARLGKRILRTKVRRYYGNADPARIGVFSNLGSWRGDTAPDLGIIPYGPPLMPDPLCAGALTWNGKLALTLRAHPSLTTDRTEVERWMAAWTGRLEGCP